MCAPPTEDSLMHRWLQLGVVVFIDISIGWPTAALASFDCARPYLKVDYVICGSSSAKNANDELTDAWQRVNTLLDPEQRRELLADQRQWISMYGGLCNVPGNGRPTKGQIDRATKCVIEKIRDRIYVINRIANSVNAAQGKQERASSNHLSDGDSTEQSGPPIIDDFKGNHSPPSYYSTIFISMTPFVLVIAAVGATAYLMRARSQNRLKSVGFKRHRVSDFSSRFVGIDQQRLVASGMSNEDLLWSIFLPEHRDTAKRVAADELTQRGVWSEQVNKWIPSGFRLPRPTNAYQALNRYDILINRRLLFYTIIRLISLLTIVCLLAGVIVGNGVPDEFNDDITKLEEYFGNTIWAYIYYALFHFYMILFFVVLLAGLIIFPLFVGQSFRIVLLRPFGEKALTRSLRKFLLVEMAGRGNLITLSDKNFKPNFIVAALGLMGWPFIFLSNPIFRGSRRIGKIKNDKTFYKLGKCIASPIGIRVSNGISCGQAFNIQCKDSWWKCCVSLLLDTSDIVLVDLSKVKLGTEWEIEEIVRRDIVERCLFVATQDGADSAREVMARHFGGNAVKIGIYLYDDRGVPSDRNGFRARLKRALSERAREPENAM